MKYLIVANGPFLSTERLKMLAENALIIALDGAANRLIERDMRPDIILGDFDSFEENEELTPIKKVKLPNQYFTDFQKALQFIRKEATCIHVACALGGRIDHEQAAIRTLVSEYSPECPIYLHGEKQILEYVRDKTIHIHGKQDDVCGFFGMPEAIMSVKNGGLAYASDAPYKLTMTQMSCSNRLTGHEGAIVEIQGAALVVHPS